MSMDRGLRASARSGVSRIIKHPLADYGFLLGVAGMLVIIGLVMVLSASTVFSYRNLGSSYTLAQRQLMFAALGLVLMFAASRMPISFFRRAANPALLGAAVLLVLVLIPGIGITAKGQQNWISLGGPFRLQPSEIAKIALIIWIADVLARKRKSVDGWRSLLIPIAPVSGAIVFLILLAGDFGTVMVFIPIIAMMLLIAGAPLKMFGWLGAGIGVLILLMSVTVAYRMKRFSVWLDPGSDPTGVGWQIINGQYALGTGGWWGVGLGASRQKWGFLPEAHTDFIIAVIGEELGLMGTLSVLGLFALLAIIVTRIAINTDNDFVRLVTTGVGAWILIQALINIGVVLGAIPIAGLPLPLVSYGGSSLTFTLIAIGMVLAFARAQPAAAALLGKQQTRRGQPRDSDRIADITDSRSTKKPKRRDQKHGKRRDQNQEQDKRESASEKVRRKRRQRASRNS